jgi:hypothetical protein
VFGAWRSIVELLEEDHDALEQFGIIVGSRFPSSTDGANDSGALYQQRLLMGDVDHESLR